MGRHGLRFPRSLCSRLDGGQHLTVYKCPCHPHSVQWGWRLGLQASRGEAEAEIRQLRDAGLPTPKPRCGPWLPSVLPVSGMPRACTTLLVRPLTAVSSSGHWGTSDPRKAAALLHLWGFFSGGKCSGPPTHLLLPGWGRGPPSSTVHEKGPLSWVAAVDRPCWPPHWLTSCGQRSLVLALHAPENVSKACPSGREAGGRPDPRELWR